MLNHFHLLALQYVKNTNGGGTLDNFVEDREPLGYKMWYDLLSEGTVMVNDNNIVSLTSKGELLLNSYDKCQPV